MKRNRSKKSALSVLSFPILASLLASALAWSDSIANPSTNPDTDASARNYDNPKPDSLSGTLEKAKDGGNRALNKVDNVVHKGISTIDKSLHESSETAETSKKKKNH